MTSFLKRAGLMAVAVAALGAGTSAPLLATTVPGVPEVNASMVSAGMGLLAAGVLILRSRRRSK